jgi:large subunit ribosomal protein L3
MINTLLATKKGMTASYDSRGRRVGATILEVSPNFVTQVKTTEGKDGYNSVQLGLNEKKSVRKPQIGHLKKAGIDQKVRWMREVRTDDNSDLEPGKTINVGQVFSRGDVVKVTGTSKGHGFQGGVKRYGFHGGPKTHGQSDRHRAPGSSGSGTTPGRVFKGHRAAGHMGVDTVSYLNLEVVAVDKKNNLLTIKGGVPGPIGGLVIVKNMGKVKGYIAPPEPEEEEEVVEAGESVDQTASESAESVDQPISESETTEAPTTDTPTPAETAETPEAEAPEGEENAG